MTASGWVGSGAVAVAAVVLAVPAMTARRRWRRLARGRRSGPAHAVRPATAATRAATAKAIGPAGALRLGSSAWWPAAAAVVGLPVAAVAGVTAGLAVAAYAVTTVVIARRRLRERAGTRARAAAVDAVVGLATDLRAGLAVGPALAAAGPAMSQVDGARPVAVRVAAAVELAETTGAPLADVLDRLDADLRAADRVRATATAQLAGARASAWLLTAMPLAGIGLGHAIGADPLRVLLRTPLGAGCLLGAVALQLAGLAWADRLARVEVAS